MHSNSGILDYLSNYVDTTTIETINIQSRFISALEKRGSMRFPGQLKGCVVMMTHPDKNDVFYYVSQNGALRIGSSRTKSEPVSDSERYDLLVEADAPQVTASSFKEPEPMNIEDIINQVESILRLRSGVRVSRENVARETEALATIVENLAGLEHGLSVMIGTSTAAKSAWHDAAMTDPRWTTTPVPVAVEVSRKKFDRPIKKGDIVWMVRRKALGTVTSVYTNGSYRIKIGKEFYLYKARNLRMPLPGEENADA